MRQIAVDGLFNARASQGAVPWLLRSGSPDALTRQGADALRELGVSVVVDLREPGESGAVAHGIPVVPVPLYGTEPPRVGRIEHVYEALLRDRGEALAAAVGVIAEATGAALVHCTAGKDRTGLVVALARLAAGDDETDVVADYALSGAHVRPMREAFALQLVDGIGADERADTLRLHLDSPPEAIRHALALIDARGGAERYLLAHGLRRDQLELLRAKRARAVDPTGDARAVRSMPTVSAPANSAGPADAAAGSGGSR